jgi:colanic acid biosynthesis glycosyl transferase WcaI
MVKQASWLILTQYYPPEIGAPQIRLRALTRHLQRSGIQVKVLTGIPNYPAGKTYPGYAGKRWMTENIDGVEVKRTWVYAATGKSALVRLMNYFSFTATAMVAALFGPRPDVLFVESQPLSLGVIALLMLYLRGIPYIYNVPDLQVDVARQMGFLRNSFFLNIALGAENLFLKKSWKVSTVTHLFINHFESRGLPRNQITFLPNGADTDFLKPSPPSSALLDRWNLHGKKVFLYVGTHAFYHGLDVLIDAAAMLQDQKDIAFLMVGDGPERIRLKQKAADLKLTNIVFGESPYEEMDQLYSIGYTSVATLRKIDVAKLMRLSKVFPSLSCAVPVIYAGTGEAAALLQEKKCGIVTEPEDAAQLANAISRLAADPALRNSLGSAGRTLVEKEYSWAAIVQHWLAELGISTQSVAGRASSKSS